MPDQRSNEVFFAEHFVHEHPEVMYLVVIDTGEDDPFLAQELPGDEQPGVHHREPRRVVAPARLRVAREEVAVGVLLAYLLTVVGEVPERATVYETATTPLLAARLLLVSLSGWVALLPVVQSCLILMIIGSWVSMLTGSHGLASFCREWIDLLIGPMRRFPLRIGMLDLTPLVFMFALGFVHVLLQSILLHSFLKLAGT